MPGGKQAYQGLTSVGCSSRMSIMYVCNVESDLHRWDLEPQEAAALQRRLASRVRQDRPRWPEEFEGLRVAGADVSCPRGSEAIIAAIVVISLPDFSVLETARVKRPADFPYIPGLLSFREAPAVIEAFGKLQTKVDALICDGQGLAHPRGMGLASHIGLWLGIPTVGCAKSRLCGEHREPGRRRGASAVLRLDGKIVGRVLRTRDNVKPLYVSVGHMIDLKTTTNLVLACCGRYRLPEPTRLAHQAAGFRGR